MITAPARGGGAYVTSGTPAMRPPMSRLGQRSSNDEFSVFPDPSQVESVASGANPELFNRSLIKSWWSPSTETLHKQVGLHPVLALAMWGVWLLSSDDNVYVWSTVRAMTVISSKKS